MEAEMAEATTMAERVEEGKEGATEAGRAVAVMGAAAMAAVKEVAVKAEEVKLQGTSWFAHCRTPGCDASRRVPFAATVQQLVGSVRHAQHDEQSQITARFSIASTGEVP